MKKIATLGMAMFVLAQPQAFAGKDMLELATQRGCFICHTLQPAPEGHALAPSYAEVASHYEGKPNVTEYLVSRVHKGTLNSEQNWAGKVNMRFMPANVNVSQDEAKQLVTWILSVDHKAVDQTLVTHEEMLTLATQSGCMTCHNTEINPDNRYVPLAPAFKAISARYQGKADAKAAVLDSVVHGTQKKEQHWENVNMQFMPPNVALKKEDADKLVSWILSM